MDYYEYLNGKIKELISTKMIGNDKKIILYPFGKQGGLVKQILNWRYGIEEAFIVDKEMSSFNPAIRTLEFLATIDVKEYVVIITSDNLSCWDEVRNVLRKYVPEPNIVDLFSWKPLTCSEPRIASLEMASREVYARHIEGVVAEAGVYKGDFARWINKFFYDKRLYLFDSFEGFPKEDINEEQKGGYSTSVEGYFGDTSVDTVLAKMPFKENIVVKKGYFPDTAKGLDEKFCFVSLDMDLYQPIRAGLEYFYPRLAKGGYIFIHDCNIGHLYYKGARVALLEFAEKMGVSYVMLPDNKTAVITK